MANKKRPVQSAGAKAAEVSRADRKTYLILETKGFDELAEVKVAAVDAVRSVLDTVG